MGATFPQPEFPNFYKCCRSSLPNQISIPVPFSKIVQHKLAELFQNCPCFVIAYFVPTFRHDDEDGIDGIRVAWSSRFLSNAISPSILSHTTPYFSALIFASTFPQTKFKVADDDGFVTFADFETTLMEIYFHTLPYFSSVHNFIFFNPLQFGDDVRAGNCDNDEDANDEKKVIWVRLPRTGKMGKICHFFFFGALL